MVNSVLSPDSNARILVVRLSAIGDVVHGLPVLNALRDALPRAWLAWLVEQPGADLLRRHRALDELIVVEPGWLKSPRVLVGLRRRLRAMKLDVAIDVQGLSRSAIAARLSGAPCRIGFAGPDGREISRGLNNTRVLAAQTHVVDRNLELLHPLGIAPSSVRFDIDDAPDDAAMARQWIDSHQLGERFAVINPGAGWPSKRWPAERFGAVAQHLGHDHALRSLVVWSGDAEQALAQQIVSASAGYAVLAPATTLRQLAAFARRAALFIASDTGPLHLAAAVGTPCVGLFGPTDAQRNGPYGPRHVTVQKMCLSGPSHQRRAASDEAMRAIRVEDVMEAVGRVKGEG